MHQRKSAVAVGVALTALALGGCTSADHLITPPPLPAGMTCGDDFTTALSAHLEFTEFGGENPQSVRVMELSPANLPESVLEAGETVCALRLELVYGTVTRVDEVYVVVAATPEVGRAFAAAGWSENTTDGDAVIFDSPEIDRFVSISPTDAESTPALNFAYWSDTFGDDATVIVASPPA